MAIPKTFLGKVKIVFGKTGGMHLKLGKRQNYFACMQFLCQLFCGKNALGEDFYPIKNIDSLSDLDVMSAK